MIMKKINNFKQALRKFWIYKLVFYFYRTKGKCKVCKQNPTDKDYGMCFDCYYKSHLDKI